MEMKQGYFLTLILTGCMVAASQAYAQAPASGDATGSGQNKQTGNGQKPAGAEPPAQPQSGSNPFPEDTSSVPVLPSKGTAALPEGTYNGSESAGSSLPSEDLDPARSPDDPPPTAADAQGADSSSSLAGLDKLLPPPGDDEADKQDKKRKLSSKEPTHVEAASEDINVGGYYLERKDWKAALSRFESAMVLDPENPDVYWGLAESARHMGQFAEARGYYQKVLDYDPDSKHGKEARKILKDPEIANAKPPAVGQTLTGGSQK